LSTKFWSICKTRISEAIGTSGKRHHEIVNCFQKPGDSSTLSKSVNARAKSKIDEKEKPQKTKTSSDSKQPTKYTNAIPPKSSQRESRLGRPKTSTKKISPNNTPRKHISSSSSNVSAGEDVESLTTSRERTPASSRRETQAVGFEVSLESPKTPNVENTSIGSTVSEDQGPVQASEADLSSDLLEGSGADTNVHIVICGPAPKHIIRFNWGTIKKKGGKKEKQTKRASRYMKEDEDDLQP
jgi:hypothetical protein